MKVFNVLAKDLSLANRLIATLPAPQRGELLACCTLVELRRHEQLIGAGQLLEYAYFPVDSFVSLVMHVPGSAGIQLALVGNEGMLPASPVLRATASPFTCKVQGPGRALRLRRHALQFAVFDTSGVRDLLDRYADVRQAQLAQQAVCMNCHSVLQRMARWLLTTRDRAHASELFLTHDVLASMLGVRRESVSRMASAMARQGLISYRHGYIVLLDEVALEALSCPCYQADLHSHAQIMGTLARG